MSDDERDEEIEQLRLEVATHKARADHAEKERDRALDALKRMGDA